MTELVTETHSEWTVSAKADWVQSYTATTKGHRGLLAATRSYESQASVLGPLVEVQPCWHSDCKIWPLEVLKKNMYRAVSQSGALVKLQEAGFSCHSWAGGMLGWIIHWLTVTDETDAICRVQFIQAQEAQLYRVMITVFQGRLEWEVLWSEHAL